MGRSFSPSAEKILDLEFKVLDKGFVVLTDYLGNDERIAQSARVSYQGKTKTKRQDDVLIDYLIQNSHTSPLEQVVMVFCIKAPIFVARQWMRHRTARINEMSGRYSVLEEEFYIPKLEDIQGQDTVNRQGRIGTLSKKIRKDTQSIMKDLQEVSYEAYQCMLDMGVARELARTCLPSSIYTRWYWQIDLNNLFRFLKLRMHEHAQKEIREYAKTIFEIAKNVAPVAFASFQKYHLN